MLKEDFVDDILDTSKNENRKYAIKDSSGAILFEDVSIEDTTDYLQEGSLFGAKELNETNAVVNELSESVSKLSELQPIKALYKLTGTLSINALSSIDINITNYIDTPSGYNPLVCNVCDPYNGVWINVKQVSSTIVRLYNPTSSTWSNQVYLGWVYSRTI